MYKDNAVGSVVAETGRDDGTATQLSDLSMPCPLCASPLNGEVRRSPEQSARPSAAADSEERQFCATCLFTLIWLSIPSHTSCAVKLSRKSGIWN